MIRQITAKELKSRLDAGETIDIVDVREDWEVAKGKLASAIHIPMDNIPDSLDQIAKDKPVVIMCHSGGRSQQVIQWMQTQGFDNLLNLNGGIVRWAKEVDPTLPT